MTIYRAIIWDLNNNEDLLVGFFSTKEKAEEASKNSLIDLEKAITENEGEFDADDYEICISSFTIDKKIKI